MPPVVIAAVIGREAFAAEAGTPGATPVPVSLGSVQVTAYACPPLVEPDQGESCRCLSDPEAVALELAMDEGAALRDVGPSTRGDRPPGLALLVVTRSCGRPVSSRIDRILRAGFDGIGGPVKPVSARTSHRAPDSD